MTPSVAIPKVAYDTSGTQIRMAAWGSGLVALVLLAAHAGTLLRIEIPSGAALVGLILYFRRPIAYIHFVLWTWFLTPLVRRLVDWRLGFEDQNLVLLAPFLVSAIAILTVRERRQCDPLRLLPFFLCIGGIFYGFTVGLTRLTLHLGESGPIGGLVFNLFNLLGPLFFGLHLYIRWRTLESNRRAIVTSFRWAVLILGSYGIYQYVSPPAWDISWLYSVMADSGSTVFGEPTPFGVRVWSTMNAPLLFAMVMMSGLVFLTEMRGWVARVGGLVGYASLLLSSVRTAWVAWAVAMLVLLFGGRNGKLRRVLPLLAMLPICIALLSLNPSIGGGLSARLGSLSNFNNDESFRARADLYDSAGQSILASPFGTGLVLGEGRVDSGLFSILMSLGLTGACFYFGGILAMTFQMLQSQRRQAGDITSKATFLAILAASLSANLFANAPGAILWMTAGLWMSKAQADSQALAEPNAVLSFVNGKDSLSISR